MKIQAAGTQELGSKAAVRTWGLVDKSGGAEMAID